jgi:hypothetical protein
VPPEATPRKETARACWPRRSHPGEVMARGFFSLRTEPRGHLYRLILQLAAEETTTAYLVVKPTISLGARGEAALKELGVHEKGRRMVSEWPGTRLVRGGTAELIEYRVSPPLLSQLASLADGLYEWLQPELPEDLGFLRADGSTWLASIAHEHDGYFELSEREHVDLTQRAPELGATLTEDAPEDGDAM